MNQLAAASSARSTAVGSGASIDFSLGNYAKTACSRRRLGNARTLLSRAVSGVLDLYGGLLAQDLFGDGQLLNVRRAFVNPADLRVAIELLHRIILGEADASENLYRA